jgi:hypothetical protein
MVMDVSDRPTEPEWRRRHPAQRQLRGRSKHPNRLGQGQLEQRLPRLASVRQSGSSRHAPHLCLGGAVHPVLFAYTNAGQLFRRLNDSWEKLDVGASLPSVWRGNEGPVFVNPYDPHHLFVVTTKDVRVSRSDIGDTLIFTPDDSLMQLLTASGKYSWNGSFGTVNENSQAPILAPSHAKTMGIITQISFSADSPHSVAVASPVTGVFYATDDHRTWRSITASLPTPLSPVSSVAIDYDAITAAGEGRSVVRVAHYDKARWATYFRLSSDPLHLAALWMSNPLSLSGEPVRVTVEDLRGNIVSDATQTTDSVGRVVFPPAIASQGSLVLVRLAYPGSRDYAPSETAFQYTTPDPRTMHLDVARVGQGNVAGSGVQCPPTCWQTYPFNAPVTLAAAPDPGWIFASWSGGCSGTGSCVLVMDESKSVTATFAQDTPQKARLSVIVNVKDANACGVSNGVVTSSPPGVSCQNDGVQTSCLATFPLGTAVTLTAMPTQALSRFEQFSGACAGSSPCTFTITGNTNVTATFCGLVP